MCVRVIHSPIAQDLLVSPGSCFCLKLATRFIGSVHLWGYSDASQCQTDPVWDWLWASYLELSAIHSLAPSAGPGCMWKGPRCALRSAFTSTRPRQIAQLSKHPEICLSLSVQISHLNSLSYTLWPGLSSRGWGKRDSNWWAFASPRLMLFLRKVTSAVWRDDSAQGS